MADLLSTVDGRLILSRLQCFLGHKYASRALERAFVIAWDDWKNTGYFDQELFLNELNPLSQDDIESVMDCLKEANCFDQTFQDEIIYVNETTGSDTDGDGSADHPYLTLNFLEERPFPTYINHKIRIIISGDVTADYINLQHKIGPNGSISILGNGAPVVHNTSQGIGPFTVTGVTTNGTPVCEYDIQTATLWAANELYGKWIGWEVGAAAEHEFLPIHDNENTGILFLRGGLTATPINGDLFKVYDILNSITCPIWNIQLEGPIDGNATYQALSRFNIFNLNINIASTTTKNDNFVLRNKVESQLSLVQIQSENDQFHHIQIHSPLNRYPAFDVNAKTLTFATAVVNNLDASLNGTNPGLSTLREDFPPATFGFAEIEIWPGAEFVTAVECLGRVTGFGNIGTVKWIGCGQFYGDEGLTAKIQAVYMSGSTALGTLYVWWSDSLIVTGCYFYQGVDVIYIRMGDLFFELLDVGMFTGVGIRFDQGSARVWCTTTPAAVTGAVGNIWFAGGLGVTAHPVADAQVTDGLGNRLAWINTP